MREASTFFYDMLIGTVGKLLIGLCTTLLSSKKSPIFVYFVFLHLLCSRKISTENPFFRTGMVTLPSETVFETFNFFKRVDVFSVLL